jgi:hypothetical protein
MGMNLLLVELGDIGDAKNMRLQSVDLSLDVDLFIDASYGTFF